MTVYTVVSTPGGGASTLVDTLADIEAVVPALGQYGFPTDSFYRLYCAVAGTWSYYVDGSTHTCTKPSAAGWLWINEDTSTVDFTPGYADLTSANLANGSWLYRDAPGANFTATALLGAWHLGGKTFVQTGLALVEKATGKTMTIEQSGDPYGYRIDVVCHIGGAYSAPIRVAAFGGIVTPWWFKVEYDGADVIFYASQDGDTFTTVYTEAVATFFTTAPDAVGIEISGVNAGVPNFPARGHLYSYVAVDTTPP